MLNKIIPKKLKNGDEIRIIAPSRSMALLNEVTINNATKMLESFGFKVTFGKNVYNVINDDYCCASIEDRVQDIHDAFKDKNVKAILTVIGGFNVNQILDYLDYNLIKENPKILCGYSDITALVNAIYEKTGLETYIGPHYSSFGMEKGLEYTIDYFKKMFMESDVIQIKSSNEWSDDLWFKNQKNRNFIKNIGMKVINRGVAKGNIIGGNLCTLNLLQGSEYMPNIDDIILFIEDDEMAGEDFYMEFDRNLQSLLHCLNGKKINGIVIGRAQLRNKMTIDRWKNILSTKKELENIPIIINADFGHTTPIFTIPIGGYAEINADNIYIRN